MEQFDVVIAGAGAAGLMCAAVAGARGRRVLLLEHGPEVGAKILISGGGRCNFTNLETGPDRFLSANRHFCKSALSRFTQRDFIAMVERHGIRYHEKALGQLFCDGSAREIVAMLLAECRAGNVEIRTGTRIGAVSRSERFRIETEHGDVEAESFVLATGGLSIPKIGATGFAYQVAERFGLALTERRPGLVPLKLDGDDLMLAQPLSGVSLEAVARCGKARFREGMLFTHRGLSGPAILQASSYWHDGEAISLDLVPDHAGDFLVRRKRERPKAELRTVLAEILPARLAQALAGDRLPDGPMNELTDAALTAAMAWLKDWKPVPSDTEGYAKAEVTLGGVDTAGLSSKTMEARAVAGLFVIGEAVDVTGWLGGYNFQWAWSSGWCAGQAA